MCPLDFKTVTLAKIQFRRSIKTEYSDQFFKERFNIEICGMTEILLIRILSEEPLEVLTGPLINKTDEFMEKGACIICVYLNLRKI